MGYSRGAAVKRRRAAEGDFCCRMRAASWTGFRRRGHTTVEMAEAAAAEQAAAMVESGGLEFSLGPRTGAVDWTRHRIFAIRVFK